MCARGDVAGSTGDLPATGLAQKTTDQQFRGNLGRGLGWGAHTAQPREDGVDKSPGRVLAVPVAQFLQQQQQKGTKKKRKLLQITSILRDIAAKCHIPTFFES